MKLAEEFDRCEKCDQAWFEAKEFVLVQKGSPKKGEPMTYKKEIHYQCVNCSHTQYIEKQV